jgi:cell division transport system permease protein
MIRQSIYFVKEALRGLFRAKLLTFVSILTIGFALFLLGGVAVAYLNIRGWVKNASTRVEAIAYVKDLAPADSLTITELLGRVRGFSQVAAARYVSKKEAWDHFKEVYGASMLNAINDNPFPASIEISLADKAQSLEAALELQKQLENIGMVEDVRISREWVQLLHRFKRYFLIATACLVLLLTVALHFMIANTIKLTIYARRELVHNMHFVGATDAYIRAPFILEGMLQGFIGGALAVGGLFIIKIIPASHVPIYWGPWYTFLLLLPVGVLFGCIGSVDAVRKFLV